MLPIWLVEFGNGTSSHEFQENAQEIGKKYVMIIDSDVMEEQDIGNLYSDQFIVKDDVRVPLKLQEELLDRRYCDRLFYMRTDSLIFQQMEESQDYNHDATQQIICTIQKLKYAPYIHHTCTIPALYSAVN